MATSRSPELPRQKIMVAFEHIAASWRPGASLAGSGQPSLEALGHELVADHALHHAEGETVREIMFMPVSRYSHVCHLPLHVGDVDGGIVEDAGELLEAAVQLLGLGGGVAGALEVAGHHVLLQAQLGQLLQAGHVAVQQLQLLLLQAQRRVGFPLPPAQFTYNITSVLRTLYIAVSHLPMVVTEGKTAPKVKRPRPPSRARAPSGRRAASRPPAAEPAPLPPWGERYTYN